MIDDASRRKVTYHVAMNGTYVDMHELVDRLTPDQAAAVRAVLRQLVSLGQPAEVATPEDADSGRVRRLSFAGAFRSGKGDLAERSEEIIRSELGRTA